MKTQKTETREASMTGHINDPLPGSTSSIKSVPTLYNGEPLMYPILHALVTAQSTNQGLLPISPLQSEQQEEHVDPTVLCKQFSEQKQEVNTEKITENQISPETEPENNNQNATEVVLLQDAKIPPPSAPHQRTVRPRKIFTFKLYFPESPLGYTLGAILLMDIIIGILMSAIMILSFVVSARGMQITIDRVSPITKTSISFCILAAVMEIMSCLMAFLLRVAIKSKSSKFAELFCAKVTLSILTIAIALVSAIITLLVSEDELETAVMAFSLGIITTPVCAIFLLMEIAIFFIQAKRSKLDDKKDPTSFATFETAWCIFSFI
jgi:hypothetical protein